MAVLDIEAARKTLYQAILDVNAVSDLAVTAPGISFDPAIVPRLEIEQAAAQHPMVDLKGQIYTETGVVVVTAVVAKGEGQAQAMQIAKEITAAFAVGTTITISGTSVLWITNHPSIRAGYADDHSWRLPVEIQYLARG